MGWGRGTKSPIEVPNAVPMINSKVPNNQLNVKELISNDGKLTEKDYGNLKLETRQILMQNLEEHI